MQAAIDTARGKQPPYIRECEFLRPIVQGLESVVRENNVGNLKVFNERRPPGMELKLKTLFG